MENTANVMGNMEKIENQQRQFVKSIKNMEDHLVKFDDQFAQFASHKDLDNVKSWLVSCDQAIEEQLS